MGLIKDKDIVNSYLKLTFVPKFCLNNDWIECVDKMKYLGFLLRLDLRDDDDMNRQLRSIYAAANAINSFYALNL